MVVLSRGRLVTFEGGEGAGKSTQLPLLAEHLRARGVTVVTTREPGGTAGAEAIRALLVQGGTDRWAVTTELLLLAAARDDHVRRVIRPALDAGSWVLCDRFIDSTRVYQGLAGGLGVDTVDALHRLILGDLQPDLTLLLDVDPASGLERRGEGGAETRFERKGRAFHEQVREGFRSLAAAEPRRFAVIVGSADIWKVAGAVRDAVRQRLGIG
ncbi:MAG: dTMP kinase [Geminicoccaceae bacterium]